MSYFLNPALGGIGGMFEYENAVSMGIDQVNTYHPMWTSGVVVGTIDGWTFTTGADGSFTSVANLGGGRMRFTTSAPHGLANGRIVAITSASVAGYQPPNPTIFAIFNVSASTFDVTGTFTTTATGTWAAGACLTAGPSAAGKYQLFWSVGCKSTGANKLYKFEPCQNVTNVDKAASSSLLTTTDLQSISASAFITVAAGDVVTLLCQNQTDATDITIVYTNVRVIRYAQ